MESIQIDTLLRVAGLAQIALVAGSFAIPKVLNWRNELAKVQPLIKQMFWTYAAYILVINLCFGLLSVFGSKELVNGSVLALLITGFIAIYWISRVLIQFLYFDRTNFPAGKWNKLAEVLLVALFIFLSIVYSLACYINYKHS
ncbi:hypothetical protein HDF18_00215 [Mucilaginibacter sp. X5P1]|uniref:hypothetical protein n=1 Tax=Mucilaginibacter sp. X5P1 TaxID=2723088 RepID=UPI00160AFA43|nr:hypothetical protein [Mucilaginibacter sp. X5P1]MBB6138483.1 phosphoglycerol transferase MdoB-like AlkP superfamily enzyme [Mucilaginibacter sp. X5P1]